ncbi:4'-phosphopantetheinyl transferase superfamily protein [Cryobacterium cheniae]|uniref:4'-phosphopantetheinyl transferase superfamily protein n=1 Tax=Cryobacterium cheniae TaxID=1259262 RepID=A0A4R8XJ66_9MICO|nr:4'-phosphopantetheinyl transferase superfamily protein [Cryobacterium cheniae]TFC77986.1 4'-phosphopantetheinyl transferase superfamily protein [Cryobacterium cheniae]
MTSERAGDVFLVVAPRGATDAAERRFLAAAASWLLGVDPATVHIERSCPHCGGRDHGRPLVAMASGCVAGSRALHVSLGRAGGRVAFALTFLGPVGVDIESVAAVSRGGFDAVAFDAVAFGPTELAALAEFSPSDAAGARARLWTAKEAVLKCTGDGLRVDPRDLAVSLPGRRGLGTPRLDAWRGTRVPVDAIRLRGIDPGPGLVGTVAVLAEGGLAAGGPTVCVVPADDIRHHGNGTA